MLPRKPENNIFPESTRATKRRGTTPSSRWINACYLDKGIIRKHIFKQGSDYLVKDETGKTIRKYTESQFQDWCFRFKNGDRIPANAFVYKKDKKYFIVHLPGREERIFTYRDLKIRNARKQRKQANMANSQVPITASSQTISMPTSEETETILAQPSSIQITPTGCLQILASCFFEDEAVIDQYWLERYDQFAQRTFLDQRTGEMKPSLHTFLHESLKQDVRHINQQSAERSQNKLSSMHNTLMDEVSVFNMFLPGYSQPKQSNITPPHSPSSSISMMHLHQVLDCVGAPPAVSAPDPRVMEAYHRLNMFAADTNLCDEEPEEKAREVLEQRPDRC